MFDERWERTATGETASSSPTGFDTGDRNATIIYFLKRWSIEQGGGKVTDSSTGYDLPNGANRSPDAAWVSDETLEAAGQYGTVGFLQGAPDFVIELRSPTDSLAVLRSKMLEYIENGVKLAWLIDPESKTVTVYRETVQFYENPRVMSGEPELVGFELPMVGIL